MLSPARANDSQPEPVQHLSACALLSAGSGDAAVKARGDLMVAELAKCQQAIGSGYHPADGSKLYYVPLASGYWKLFGTARRRPQPRRP